MNLGTTVLAVSKCSIPYYNYCKYSVRTGVIISVISNLDVNNRDIVYTQYKVQYDLSGDASVVSVPYEEILTEDLVFLDKSKAELKAQQLNDAILEEQRKERNQQLQKSKDIVRNIISYIDERNKYNLPNTEVLSWDSVEAINEALSHLIADNQIFVNLPTVNILDTETSKLIG